MLYNFTNFKNEIKKVEEWLAKEYSQIHTGRASPMFLDSVLVDSYGTMMPIKNVGSVSIEDARTLRVAPWDKSLVKGIEKAIGSANLGLSTVVDDNGLRVIFPMLTTENRTSIVKVLKEKLEDARISVRQEREKIWEDIQEQEKGGKMSEDDKFRAKDDLQKIIDETNQNLENIFEKKQKEIMEN